MAIFTVSLSDPTANTVTVLYSTADNIAASGDDYTSASGIMLTFYPGETSQLASVQTANDILDEYDEDFYVINLAIK